MKRTILGVMLIFGTWVNGEDKLKGSPIDMDEMRDASTLDVKVIEDWHKVKGEVDTRQKLINIRVGELWSGQDLRIPVRMIVPADSKAKGFHLTGGHTLSNIKQDAKIRGIDGELLKGGVGLVYTIVQEPGTYGERKLAVEMKKRFIKTLNPHYSIQYWGWPAILMRSITAAYAEKDHFERGKIATSGSSKNGATPSAAIIQDKRITAVHGTISPIWESPLRLCDEKAWEELNRYNKQYAEKVAKGDQRKIDKILHHRFLGGTFGPIYNRDALAAGHSWDDIKNLAKSLEDSIFISKNLDQLKERKCDIFFHPGTNDFVCFDVAWGGKHYPHIPLYLKVNSGHGKKGKNSSAEKNEQNKSAFLLNHFFKDKVDSMLPPPKVEYKKKGSKLLIKIKFPEGSKAESGRVWWIYDRAPDGSFAYIDIPFPEEQWKDMKYDDTLKAWSVEIDLEKGKSHIDFFSNHRKTIKYKSNSYQTYITSPYTRVEL